jgi:histidine phosphotransferase ChpT
MPVVSSSLLLAETLAARLCHDFASPLGSLMGVLELAREGDTEALGLAAETAQKLGQRLRLLRAAWGARPGPLGVAELPALAEGLPGRHRIELDFSGLAPSPDFAPEAGRLVLNLLLLATEALPAGGTLFLSGAARREVLLRVAGPRAAWPAGLAGYLVDPDSAWAALDDPRALQAPLTALLAAQAGLRLALLLPSGGVTGAPPLLLDLG